MEEMKQNSMAQERRKAFQALDLSDDFLFGKVMTDPEVCRVTLEKILGVPIRKVTIPATEHVIDLLHDSKGIRLDVYVADEKGDVYNCEMQTSHNGELPRRSRYYHGCMDLDLINKGEAYESLTKAFVIFICTFDPFGQGRHIYTFRNVCEEIPHLLLGDDSYTIFLSTKGAADDVSDEMRAFLAYVENSSDAFVAGTDSDWVRQIHARVRKVKESRELEVEFMTLRMREMDKYKEGMADINRLYAYLLDHDMYDELKRSVSDKEYQWELLRTFSAEQQTATNAAR